MIFRTVITDEHGNVVFDGRGGTVFLAQSKEDMGGFCAVGLVQDADPGEVIAGIKAMDSIKDSLFEKDPVLRICYDLTSLFEDEMDSEKIDLSALMDAKIRKFREENPDA